MNHELVMLRGLSYCKKEVQRLQEQCVKAALKSYKTEKWSGGTLAQVCAIAEMACERDKFRLYLDIVAQALLDMPRGFRALIVAVYLKNVPKEQICKKYCVSLSTVYRKLVVARASFRKALERLGADETWFCETFGGTPWVASMLARKRNGSRLEM